jgi:hypothetical protein
MIIQNKRFFANVAIFFYLKKKNGTLFAANYYLSFAYDEDVAQLKQPATTGVVQAVPIKSL